MQTKEGEQRAIRGEGHGHDLIVMGASSGGVEALLALVALLPANLPAAVCIVLHISPEAPGLLPKILDRRSALPVAHATNDEPIRHGHIYTAPPDHHLLVEDGRLLVTRGPRENRHRPAVDTLFRSAAASYGPRVVGVILSGALDDGTAGLLAIKRLGGLALIQEPSEALFSGMPGSARRHVAVDYCLPVAELAPLLARLAGEPAAEGAYPVPHEMETENRLARVERAGPVVGESIGQPTTLTCPECHGPLWEIRDDGLLRFRCRTGHAFTAESMLAQQSEALEDALWMAVNTLEESALTAERLATEATERRHHYVAKRFTDKAEESRRRADVIREVIVTPKAPAGIDEDMMAEAAEQSAGG
jgi:two-component system chemotaxis response regulator CheB